MRKLQSEIENVSLSIEIYGISLKCELIELFEEKELLDQNCLKQKIIRGGFLKNKKDYLLSEAQSELNMRELRVEDADRALHESSPQLHSRRMELYQMSQLSDHPQREKELAMHRIGKKGKISSRKQELKKMCVLHRS